MDLRIPAAFPEDSEQTKTKLAAKVKPGDVLLTTETLHLGLAAHGQYYGSKSHYTHSAIMGGDGQIYESVAVAPTPCRSMIFSKAALRSPGFAPA